MKFSIYKAPVTNLYPERNITIEEFRDIIKSDKYKQVCETARQLKSEGKTKELIEHKKNNFDYVTFAGNFEKRERKSLKGLSGLYAADIDDIENVDEVRNKLIEDKYTNLLFTSPSGGLKAVIRIPTSLDDFEKYVVSYYEYLEKNYEIKGKLDKKTKDPSRACFISYDPECFFNEDCERWDIKKEEPTSTLAQDVVNAQEETPGHDYPSYSEQTLKAMLKHIPCRNWGEHTFYVMMALIHYGKHKEKDYFGLFRWWIKTYDNTITVEDMQKKWNEYSNKETDKPVTIRSLVHEAVEHGYKFPEKKKNVGFDPLTNVKVFYDEQPFFYDRSKIFWMWNLEESKYEIVDEIDIMNMIEETLGLYGQTISSKVKAEYLEAFKRVGRLNIPKPTPTKWIQFKDKAYSIKSGKLYDVTPNYFFTNPISYEIGDCEDTPTMDKLFTEWVGEDYVQDLYEILAYCCYREYPIQVMLCLYGCGRNGKSQYLKIIDKFLGITNICSTELDLIAGSNSSRFEVFKLYKKLACMLGETNFGILSSTSILKKLVGGDVIGFEKKGKDPFDDYNYAKIIIASNSLPSTEDSSDGFMRRWHIIDFPNEFPEGKDIFYSIPDIEYNNLAKKICRILPQLLDNGEFKNQGNIEHRKTKYMMVSNPLPIFIKKCCEVDHDYHEKYNKVYTEYVKYLLKHKKRKVKMKEFKDVLENEGYYIEKTAFKNSQGDFENGYYIIGLRLNFDNFDNFDNNPTQFPIGVSVGKGVKKVKIVKNTLEIEENYINSDNNILKDKLKAGETIQVTDKNEQEINKLKHSGDVFEVKPGFVRRLD
jgi:P4 family phage/plasmid primase-like protien